LPFWAHCKGRNEFSYPLFRRKRDTLVKKFQFQFVLQFFLTEREKEREIFKCLFCQAKLDKLNCDHKPPNQNLNFENHKFFAVKMLVLWHFLKHTNWKLDSTGWDLKALMIYLIENSNFENELKGIDLFTIIYFIYESLRHTN
jgi:hypothetical protein